MLENSKIPIYRDHLVKPDDDIERSSWGMTKNASWVMTGNSRISSKISPQMTCETKAKYLLSYQSRYKFHSFAHHLYLVNQDLLALFS